MDTMIKMFVCVEFKLPSLADRDALEAKINTFISGQAEGSYRVNLTRDDPRDNNAPIWFQTRLFIEALDIATVQSARSAILGNLETMGEVIKFELEMKETMV